MKKQFLSLALSFAVSCITFSQTSVDWEQNLGGTGTDVAKSVQQLSDGGYILTGASNSNNFNVAGNHGMYDCWVVKLDEEGEILWQNCLGGSQADKAESIRPTTDGGFIVAGNTQSDDGDVSGHHGDYDFWVVKLDADGSIIWQNCLGGSSWDYAYSIQQTNDEGYIVAGNTFSDDGDVSGNHGSYDYWIVKLNSSGEMMWQKCLGGSTSDEAREIHQTADGGYIVSGYSMSNDGDVSGNNGMADYWTVKLNAEGDIEWQKCHGGSSYDEGTSIHQTSDDGFIVAGYSSSEDGDVTGNHGYNDYWVVKLDESGEMEWESSLGGSDEDYARSIRQTEDNGYVVAGRSESTDGQVSGNHGEYDYWIAKLNSNGDFSWGKSIGGSGHDWAYAIVQTNDDGYAIAGEAQSFDGDVGGNYGYKDYWIAKLAPTTTGFESTSTYSPRQITLQVKPNPFHSQTEVSFKLQDSKRVAIVVSDIDGNFINTLCNQQYSSGKHSIRWKGVNKEKGRVKPGLYFIKVKVNGSVNAVKKVIHL